MSVASKNLKKSVPDVVYDGEKSAMSSKTKRYETVIFEIDETKVKGGRTSKLKFRLQNNEKEMESAF